MTQIFISNSMTKIKILLVVTIAISKSLNETKTKNRITYIYDFHLIVHDWKNIAKNFLKLKNIFANVAYLNFLTISNYINTFKIIIKRNLNQRFLKLLQQSKRFLHLIKSSRLYLTRLFYFQNRLLFHRLFRCLHRF